ncbi:MAG: Iron-regulated protein A [Flavobacterium sp. SCGC AAA160-P02]|nr:MAG: Iron-regulated protein A [Flavobacterium sp. SCGC AAA160-P02]
MLKKFVILFISVSILYSCSDDENDIGLLPDNFDRDSMLAFSADEIIIPSYNDFANKMSALKTAGQTFTDTPNQNTLDALRTSWYNGYKTWQSVEMFNLGKAEELQYYFYMNVYPLTVSDVENNIANGGYDLTISNNQDAQGFPALDYLLYGLSDNDTNILAKYTTDPNSSGYKLYLTDVLNRMHSLTQEVVNDWNGSYRNTFVNSSGNTATSSLNKLVNDFIYFYEKGLRTNKIGTPAGVFSGTPRPQKVEAFYKKDISKELALDALTAVENFFNGKKYDGNSYGDSYSSYLVYLDRNDIKERIDNQLNIARSQINNLNNNFYEQINADNSKMTIAFDELQKLVYFFKTDMLRAFNIESDYQDGDND